LSKFPLYILLILIYLGLTKQFAPAQRGVIYVQNEQIFNELFHGSPLTLILKNMYTKGIIIKSHFHRYRVVQAFQAPREITVRVSKDFYQKNEVNLGMSLFRRFQKSGVQVSHSFPSPPGTLFIGNTAYGYWRKDRKQNEIQWKFYRAYKHFPTLLGWSDYRPSKKFYRKLSNYTKNQNTFYGDETIFGTEGSITKKVYSNYLRKEARDPKVVLRKVFENLMSLNIPRTGTVDNFVF